MRPLALCAVLLTARLAAAAPIPEDKQAYVGEWEGHGVTLSISAGGQVAFEKASGAFSRKLSGFFTGFDGNDLKMNALITTLTIKVQEPPHQDRGVWLMTVEGAQVLKKPAGGPAEAGGPGRRARVTQAIETDFTHKGVAIKKLFCPSDAEDKSLFVCLLTTALGDTYPIKCTFNAMGTLDFAVDCALIDGARLEQSIAKLFLGKPGIKVEAKCPGRGIMKKPGESFACTAAAGKRTYAVKITVKDIAGNVSIDY